MLCCHKHQRKITPMQSKIKTNVNEMQQQQQRQEREKVERSIKKETVSTVLLL